MEEQLKSIEQKLLELDTKVVATYRSSEKMRKYFLWTLVITLIVLIGPLLILPFVIPAFLQSVTIPTSF